MIVRMPTKEKPSSATERSRERCGRSSLSRDTAAGLPASPSSGTLMRYPARKPALSRLVALCRRSLLQRVRLSPPAVFSSCPKPSPGPALSPALISLRGAGARNVAARLAVERHIPDQRDHLARPLVIAAAEPLGRDGGIGPVRRSLADFEDKGVIGIKSHAQIGNRRRTARHAIAVKPVREPFKAADGGADLSEPDGARVALRRHHMAKRTVARKAHHAGDQPLLRNARHLPDQQVEGRRLDMEAHAMQARIRRRPLLDQEMAARAKRKIKRRDA